MTLLRLQGEFTMGDYETYWEDVNAEANMEAQETAIQTELLDALMLCECELSLYVVLAEQSNNPQAWHDAITAARIAIRNVKDKR